jgi:hypothetical protein
MKTLLFLALGSLTVTTLDAQNRISVRLYNLSGISPETLDRATREASHIFARVNVDLIWTAGDPEADEVHAADQSAPKAYRDAHVRPYLVVRVGRGLAIHVPSDLLGVSLPHSRSGISATIYQENVENMCKSGGWDFDMMLGHAIAHEIGHVTLASNAHAPAGIMRARWGKTDFDQAATGQLGFTRQQGAEIRAYASRVVLQAGK